MALRDDWEAVLPCLDAWAGVYIHTVYHGRVAISPDGTGKASRDAGMVHLSVGELIDNRCTCHCVVDKIIIVG